MSDNCCTFATEIGKGREIIRPVKRKEQRWGATLEE